MEGGDKDSVNDYSGTTATIYAAICGAITLVLLTLIWKLKVRDGEQFWHHAVRLPSRMRQPYWYLISISTGCRPWAGHEGDIFLRLVGSRSESRIFLVNGEVHSRLWEADSHLYLYSSSWPLGDINYVTLACRSSRRKKRWYLSSVQIKFVTQDPTKEKTWYFPYHEWIEVFQDPIKVTLCAVNDDHDFDRRLMLGWLGRSFTDFHLWTSVFAPLKYTPFRRNERVACISVQFLGSFLSCAVLNGLIPQLGAIVLALFGSSCAMAPATTLEAALRRIEWRYKILLEDIKWYKAAEEGFGEIGRPKTYRQYRLKPTHKKMNYDLMFQDETDGGFTLDSSLKEIIEDDDKFWNWLDPSIELPELDHGSKSSLGSSNKMKSKISLEDEAQGEEEEEEFNEEEEETWLEKMLRLFKGVFADEAIDSSTALDQSGEKDQGTQGGTFADKLNILNTAIMPTLVGNQEAGAPQLNTEDFGVEAFEVNEIIEKKEKKKKPILYVGDGFLVDPVSVWQVDDEFSIDSLDMAGMNLDDFTTMESMPAAEFEGFKKRKNTEQTAEFTPSEMKIRTMMGTNRRGGIAEIGETVSEFGQQWGNNVSQITFSSEIQVPPKLDLLTVEEIELVSWIYYDRCVHGNRWLKKNTPLAAVLLSAEEDGGYREIDWYGVDVDSSGEGEADFRQYARAFVSDDYHKKKGAIRKIRAEYPEPVPRERIFSMLMFPDYVDKLNKAYDQMLSSPESWSALADLYAEWAECDEGPVLFCEACITVSKLPGGENIVRNIMSCARTSSTWTILICELTQRLRYQGDNVERLKEKYGLDNECLINACEPGSAYSLASMQPDTELLKMPHSAFEIGDGLACNSEGQLNPESKPSLQCVYTELQRLSEWRKKLQEVEIALKGCPMSELKSEEARKMSRFYRSMLKTPEGCALFGELLRQITISNNKGRCMVCRVVRYVAGQSDGVPHLNQLLQGLGQTGITGRRILRKIYSMVENRKPSGPRVITRLGNALSTVEMGSLVLKDLQLDAARAHRRAHEVRQTIRRNLDPIIRRSRRNVCQLVMSLNEIAKYMLGVADNARSVLEGSVTASNQTMAGEDLAAIAQNQGLSTIDNPRAVNDEIWNSERNCCKNYRDLQHQINREASREKKEKSRQPEYFELSGSSSEVPFITRKPPKPDPPLVSELWKPIDGRGDVINIYRKKDGPDEKIKTSSIDGFKPPCAPKIHCEAQNRMNQNEFFLQSKDYERFNLNFRYKPPVGLRDLEPNFHHQTYDPDREISRCWKPPLSTTRRNAYVVPQTTAIDAESSCVNWGKDIKEDPENWGGVAMCICHHGDHRHKNKMHGHDHDCLICNIAGDLKSAETSEDIVNILSVGCENVPTKSVHELERVPVVERSTIKKIHEVLRKKNVEDCEPEPVLPKDNETNEQDPQGGAPVPSGHVAEASNSNIKDGLTNDVFPNCGTRIEKLCQCVGGDKRRKNVSITARFQRMLGLEKETADNSSNTTQNTKKEDKADCTAMNILPLQNVRPDTALRRRQETKNVQFTSRSPSVFHAQHKPDSTKTKDYEFPVKTSSPSQDLSMLTRKDDPEYWARQNSEISVFSRPAVATPPIYCDVCGGLLVPGHEEGTVVNYLSKKGEEKRQGDAMSEVSSSQDLCSIATEITDTASWKSATGCCNNSGCYARIPRNTHYRHKRKEDNGPPQILEEPYTQWMEKAPCGNVFCSKIAETDFERKSLDSEPISRDVDDITNGELSDTATFKYSPSIDSYGMLRDPKAKFPITAKTKKIEEVRELMGKVCDLCKFPKFECCGDFDDVSSLRRRKGPYCRCEKTDSASEKSSTILSAKPHSVCSQCHVRLGTQQKPPFVRYLLPLKIVRCYENALAKHGKALSTDSGVSMYTALDVHSESDLAPINENEQLTLLDLMGLSGRPGVKRRRRRCKPVEPTQTNTSLENCSVCSSTTSSGICCHVHSARLQPVLHLQGYTCRKPDEYSDVREFPPLSFDWWQKHEAALHTVQSCADACVCLAIVLAKDKSKALTDHEQSCQVCSFVGGTPFNPRLLDHNSDGAPLGPRYSEFLPTIWRSEVRSMGRRGERAHLVEIRRPRFYKQLVGGIVESTRMLLLTPDLRPDRLTATTSVHERLLLGKSSDGSSEDSEIEKASQGGETYVTTAHVGRLAHFRAMMKCLNDVQHEGSRLRSCNLVGDRDVTVVTMLQQQKDGADEEKEHSETSEDDKKQAEDPKPSLIDLIINFLKKKACGGVLDCRELLEAPWELPTDQQQISGRLLKKIDSVLSGRTESSRTAVEKSQNWEESLGCIVDAYINEVVFRATAQTNVYKAIRRSTTAKKHMSKLSYTTRLAVARLVRFAELTQAATANLKQAIKDGLAAVDRKKSKILSDTGSIKSTRTTTPRKSATEMDEQSQFVKSHIAALLRTGRDDRRATLDDVLISFERLRGNVLDDMRDSAKLVKNVADLGDDSALWTLSSVNAKNIKDTQDDKSQLKCWTESELEQDSGKASHSHDEHKTENEIYPSSPKESTASDQDLASDPEQLDPNAYSDTKISVVADSIVQEINPLLLATKAAQWKRTALPGPSAGNVTSVVNVPSTEDIQESETRSFATCPSRPQTEFSREAVFEDQRFMSTASSRAVSPPPSASGRFSDVAKSTKLMKHSAPNRQLDTHFDFLHDKSKKRGDTLNEPLIEEARVENAETLPHKFHSVFRISSFSDFHQEEHTRQALHAEKGKGMLQCIFGTEMTEVEMVEAFHGNIHTLLAWQNSSFEQSVGLACRIMLFLLAVGFGIGACILPFYFESTNYTLLSAIPIAILSHGLILEPLKCFAVTWYLFLQRLKPAFHNNPLYMKSNPLLLQRSRLSHPRVSDEFRIITEEPNLDTDGARGEGEDEYYYKFCDNIASTRPFDRRRRKLPVLTENDVSLDLHAVASYGGVTEAAPNRPPLQLVPDDSTHSSAFFSIPDDSLDYGGFRREGVDMGGDRSSSSSACGPVGHQPRRNAMTSQTGISVDSSSSEERPEHTPITYCRYSQIPS